MNRPAAPGGAPPATRLDARAMAEVFARLREARPLVHHITNDVVTNDTANVTLHVGAAPVMAVAPEEVADMVTAAGVLLLNIGTLTVERLEAMQLAAARAAELGRPIVLDPVGAGATAFRTAAATELLDAFPVTIVRGNAGEIGSLAGTGGEVRGVDSLAGDGTAREAAAALAHRWRTTAAATGARDVVSDGRRQVEVANGHVLLAAITGSGCMATTVVACCAAVEPDALLAAATGLVVIGLAGERAAQVAAGPGSFKVALLDALAALTPDDVAAGARVAVGSAP